MKKGLFTFLLLIISSLPALAASGNTSGPWGMDAGGFKNLSTALASPATAGKTVVVSEPMALNNKTVTGGRTLKIIQGGSIVRASGKTLAFAGDSNLEAGAYQIFSGSGSTTFSTPTRVRPEWWPNNDMGAAVASLPSAGGVVELLRRNYRSKFDSDANKLTHDNIAFIGSGMPTVNAGATALENGTVIQGMVSIFANNISFQDLGVDSGVDVCNAYYGGVAQEGLIIAAAISHPAATQPFVGYRAENIQTLCKDATAAVHAFLCEYVDGAFVKNIHTKFGTHGIVFKTINTNGTGLYAKDHASDGVIIKADTYAASNGSNYSGINIQSTTQGVGGGLFVLGATANLSHINITNIRVDNTSYGIQVFGSPGSPNLSAEDVSIVNANVTNTSGFGIYTNAQSSYVNIVNGVVNSGLNSGFYVETGASYTQLINCRARNNAGNGFDVRGVGAYLSNCTAQGNSGWGAYVENNIWGDNNYFSNDNTLGTISLGASGKIVSKNASFAVTQPTLLNSWVNHGAAGSPVAGWWVDNGRVRLQGLVKSGTIGSPMFVLPVGYRPITNKRLTVNCFNGTTIVAGELIIGSGGDVVLTYGANDYVSLDGVEFSLAFD